jgi:hypothetical protein
MLRGVGPDILIVDRANHQPVVACSGPDASGACPLVAQGTPVPCAGMDVVPAAAPDSTPFFVSCQMTLCPRTLAEAICVPSDSALLVA